MSELPATIANVAVELGYVEQPCELPEVFRCTWVRRGSGPRGRERDGPPGRVRRHRGRSPCCSGRPRRTIVTGSCRSTPSSGAGIAGEVADAVWAGRMPACWKSLITSPWQIDLVKSLLHARSGAVERTGRVTGVSERQALRTTRDLTGLTPRELGHVGRLHRVLTLIEHRASSLASIAVQAGYNAQAHMTHDLKLLTGVTPRALRSERLDPPLCSGDRWISSAGQLLRTA